jgi:glycosyltransferase involved in cell wall biosynthesis
VFLDIKRPDLLERCLAALLAQHFPPTRYEILIIDDANCATTRQQVEHRAKQVRACGHTLRYVPVIHHNHVHGPAIARNLGWQAARGEIIAFTDDDCIPEPDWLQAGVAALKDGAMAASGRVHMPLSDEKLPTDYEYNAAHLAQSEFVTANSFYCREALALVGGFDERFTSAWREDSDLYFTLLEQGISCVQAPDAVVIHPVRPARRGIGLRQQSKSMFNALLYKKHPVLYRKKIQATPPWHYYGILGAALLACLGISKRSAFLTYGGAGLWLYQTLRFCMQRLRHTSHAPEHVLEMLVTSALIPPLAVFWRLRGAVKFRVFFL